MEIEGEEGEHSTDLGEEIFDAAAFVDSLSRKLYDAEQEKKFK